MINKIVYIILISILFSQNESILLLQVNVEGNQRLSKDDVIRNARLFEGMQIEGPEIQQAINDAKEKSDEDRRRRSSIDRRNGALTLIAQAERRLRDAALELGPYGAERQQRSVENSLRDLQDLLEIDEPQELEISVSALQEALVGLNRKFAAEKNTDNNPLQSIKNTFGSLKDELFSDDYWDDDPWDNQMNRNYRNSRYGNSRGIHRNMDFSRCSFRFFWIVT